MASYNFKDINLYKKAFGLTTEISEITKLFPKEERYSLTNQIRRSPGSVCANLAEAYRKKRCPAHFIPKLTNCTTENSETNVWIEFAYASKYIDEVIRQNLLAQTEETGKTISHAINNPEKY